MDNTTTPEPEKPGQFAAAHGWAAGDADDDDDCCQMCGGDGVVMLSECGPSEWGEDCFCEDDRPIACPECRERARYEAMKQQMAKRPNNQAHLPPPTKTLKAPKP